jgi:hypothetical protein
MLFLRWFLPAVLAVVAAATVGFAGLTTQAVAGDAPLDLGATAPDEQDPSAAFRAGDADRAVVAWEARLDARVDGPHERARLAHNLGVAAHAAGDPLRAVAWYESALRLAPRHRGAAHNLELARADAGLAPKASGDVTSTALGLLRRFERHEAEWLALAGAALVLVLGLLEAFRGGRALRGLWIGGVLLQPLFWGPLVRHALVAEADPVMVVAEGVPVYAMPRAEGKPLTRLDPGTVTERIETYGDWTKVIVQDEERWIRADAAFPLAR